MRDGTSESSRGAPGDPLHDPGPEVAAARADAVPIREAAVVRPRDGGEIRVGTAGWTDRSLLAPGVFYPPSAATPEERLRYYAHRFPIVEVDSPFYALPSRRNAERWVERTPDDFVFDLKAHALMTGHASEVARLPPELRKALPPALRERERVYAKDLPPELHDAVWTAYADALEPLHASGKLGAVLLQYPRWFLPGRASREAILDARRRLAAYEIAVEFRNRRWLAGPAAERTLAFLAEHSIPYVMVDEPQGLESSVPPVAAVTSRRLGVLRLHGRRAETWERRGATVAERYRYLYTKEELAEWVPKLVDAVKETRALHVIHNNSHGNYGTTNALEFTLLLSHATRTAPGAGSEAGTG